MSGGNSIGGGSLGGNEQTCETLVVRTPLNSPNPDVVPQLRKGQVLAIELRGTSLIVLTAGGLTAGSITSVKIAKIVECIRKGFQYVALILEIRGGHCELEVRPRSM